MYGYTKLFYKFLNRMQQKTVSNILYLLYKLRQELFANTYYSFSSSVKKKLVTYLALN